MRARDFGNPELYYALYETKGIIGRTKKIIKEIAGYFASCNQEVDDAWFNLARTICSETVEINPCSYQGKDCCPINLADYSGIYGVPHWKKILCGDRVVARIFIAYDGAVNIFSDYSVLLSAKNIIEKNVRIYSSSKVVLEGDFHFGKDIFIYANKISIAEGSFIRSEKEIILYSNQYCHLRGDISADFLHVKSGKYLGEGRITVKKMEVLSVEGKHAGRIRAKKYFTSVSIDWVSLSGSKIKSDLIQIQAIEYVNQGKIKSGQYIVEAERAYIEDDIESNEFASLKTSRYFELGEQATLDVEELEQSSNWNAKIKGNIYSEEGDVSLHGERHLDLSGKIQVLRGSVKLISKGRIELSGIVKQYFPSIKDSILIKSENLNLSGVVDTKGNIDISVEDSFKQSGKLKTKNIISIKTRDYDLFPQAKVGASRLVVDAKNNIVTDKHSEIKTSEQVILRSRNLYHRGCVETKEFYSEQEFLTYIAGRVSADKIRIVSPIFLMLGQLEAKIEIAATSYVSVMLGLVRTAAFYDTSLISFNFLAQLQTALNASTSASFSLALINTSVVIANAIFPAIQSGTIPAQVLLNTMLQLVSKARMPAAMTSLIKQAMSDSSEANKLHAVTNIITMITSFAYSVLAGYGSINSAMTSIAHPLFTTPDIGSVIKSTISYAISPFSMSNTRALVSFNSGLTFGISETNFNAINFTPLEIFLGVSRSNTSIAELDGSYNFCAGSVGSSAWTGIILGNTVSPLGGSSYTFSGDAVLVSALPFSHNQYSIQANRLTILGNERAVLIDSAILTKKLEFNCDATLEGSRVKSDELTISSSSVTQLFHSMIESKLTTNDGELKLSESAVNSDHFKGTILSRTDLESNSVLESTNEVVIKGELKLDKSGIKSNKFTATESSRVQSTDSEIKVEEKMSIDSSILTSDNTSFIAGDLSATGNIQGKSATFIAARGDLSGRVNTKELNIKFANMSGAEAQTLIAQQGKYKDISPSEELRVQIEGDAIITQSINRSCGVDLIANSITVNEAVHSDRGVELDATQGNIEVNSSVTGSSGVGLFSENANVTVNSATVSSGHQVTIQGQKSCINNEGVIAGDIVLIEAKTGDGINKAGTIHAGTYLGIKAKQGSVIDECKISGGSDHAPMNIKSGEMIGGTGQGYDGIGAYIEGDKVIIDASNIASEGDNVIKGTHGIESKGEAHRYISSEHSSSGFLGLHHTHTIEEATQVKDAVIRSSNGSNYIISEEGEIDALSTEFLANNGRNIIAGAKGDDIRSIIAATRSYKYEDWAWVFYKRHNQEHQYSIPSIVTQVLNSQIYSTEGSVKASGLVALGGELTMSAPHGSVLITTPVLDHCITESSFLPTFSSPITSLLSGDISSVLPVYGNFNSLINSQDTLSAALNAWNTRYDLTRSSSVNLASFSLGVSAKKSQLNYQTLGVSGISVSSLVIEAEGEVKSEGVPIYVSGNAVFRAGAVKINGIALDSSSSLDQAGLSANCSFQGVDFNGNSSHSEVHTRTYTTAEIDVGGTLELEAPSVELNNAIINASDLTGHVDHLTMNTQANRNSSESESLQVGTAGNFNVNVVTQSSASIGKVSALNIANGFYSQGFTVGEIKETKEQESFYREGISVAGNITQPTPITEIGYHGKTDYSFKVPDISLKKLEEEFNLERELPDLVEVAAEEYSDRKEINSSNSEKKDVNISSAIQHGKRYFDEQTADLNINSIFNNRNSFFYSEPTTRFSLEDLSDEIIEVSDKALEVIGKSSKLIGESMIATMEEMEVSDELVFELENSKKVTRISSEHYYEYLHYSEKAVKLGERIKIAGFGLDIIGVAADVLSEKEDKRKPIFSSSARIIGEFAGSIPGEVFGGIFFGAGGEIVGGVAAAAYVGHIIAPMAENAYDDIKSAVGFFYHQWNDPRNAPSPEEQLQRQLKYYNSRLF